MACTHSSIQEGQTRTRHIISPTFSVSIKDLSEPQGCVSCLTLHQLRLPLSNSLFHERNTLTVSIARSSHMVTVPPHVVTPIDGGMFPLSLPGNHRVFLCQPLRDRRIVPLVGAPHRLLWDHASSQGGTAPPHERHRDPVFPRNQARHRYPRPKDRMVTSANRAARPRWTSGCAPALRVQAPPTRASSRRVSARNPPSRLSRLGLPPPPADATGTAPTTPMSWYHLSAYASRLAHYV